MDRINGITLLIYVTKFFLMIKLHIDNKSMTKKKIKKNNRHFLIRLKMLQNKLIKYKMLDLLSFMV